jgi:hypothetical protein
MAVGKAALGKVEDIARAILVLRGRRVLLDAELAVLYGVTTRRLNEQVRRNRKRFPHDFLFMLTTEEFANLKSRFCDIKLGWSPQTPARLHRARRDPSCDHPQQPSLGRGTMASRSWAARRRDVSE